MKRLDRQLFGSRFKAGTYSAVAALLVIVLAVAANLAAGTLPESVTRIDLTRQSLYTLSEQTKRIVSSLDRDVDLYLLANTGREKAEITRLLSRYAALSSHIRVSYIDPTAQPTFLNAYDLTTANMNENSVIADCGGKYRLVDYSEIFVDTYVQDPQSGGYTRGTDFDGENAITNAIHYVSGDALPQVYLLSGHGEKELSDSMLKLIAQDNIETKPLHLLSLDAIPEDADVILIHWPKSDLAPEEAEKLISYLQTGGRVVLITDYIQDGTMENLLSVAAFMGMSAGKGLIVEGDASMCISQYAYYLLPALEDHAITAPLKGYGYYVFMPLAQPIERSGNAEASVQFLLTTSRQAYLKSEGLSTKEIAKADGDPTGPFHVAAVSERGEGRLCWFAAGDMLSDVADRTVSGGNGNLFMNTLNYMTEQEESISIRAKSLNAQGLTLTKADHTFWGVLLIGVIPLALVGCGVIILIRRKKR